MALQKCITSQEFQIGNPCTFLAQDKVKSFAEQKLDVLLRNTEKVRFKIFSGLPSQYCDL